MDERYWAIKKIIIKKMGYIVLCGVVCAGLLVIEKAFFTDFHVQTGSFLAETVMAVHEDPKSAAAKQKINYTTLIYWNVNLNAVIKELEQTHHFDFTKLVYNWERLNDQAKIKWMQAHIRVYPNGNVYTVVFFLNKKELLDLTFLQQNAGRFMNVFTKHNIACIQKAKPNNGVNLIGTQMLFPKEVDVKKSNTLIKYGSIGFVLGTVLASILVLVRGLWGQQHG